MKAPRLPCALPCMGIGRGDFLLRPASDPHHHRPAIASTTQQAPPSSRPRKKTRGKQVAGAGMLMHVASEGTFRVPPITPIFIVRHQTPEREAASRRFADMPSAPKPASTNPRYWRVSVPGGKRPEYVGIVEAPDQQSAEATAVKQFRLTDEERERLVVRTRG